MAALIVPLMSENIFIKKRKRQRKAGAINLSLKHLLGLVLLSLVTYGAFRFWVGNPMESLCGDNCESMYSLLAWVMAFAMVFAAIIATGAVIGVIIALIKRRNARSDADFAARFGADAPSEPADEDTLPPKD